MAHLAKDANGHLLKNADGHLANDCGNPCAPDPAIKATVVGTTGTITWLGETWNLPSDSGVTKIVCPTLYIRQHTYQVSTLPHTRFASHYWVFSQAGKPLDRLKLKRFINDRNPPFYNQTWSNRIYFPKKRITNTITNTFTNYTTTTYHTPYSSFFTYFTPTGTYTTTYTTTHGAVDVKYQFGTTFTSARYEIGVGTGWNLPTIVSDYLITDDFFGQTTVNGVTYKWERGQGWP